MKKVKVADVHCSNCCTTVASSPGPIPSFINIACCKAGGRGMQNQVRDVSRRENLLTHGCHV